MPDNTLQEYAKLLIKSKKYPENPYAHASALLETNERNILEAEIDESELSRRFSKLLDKQIQLANINSDEMLRLHQNSAILLVHFFSLALIDNELTPLVQVLYYGWKAELLLTKTKDGAERKFQAGAGGSYQPEYLGGYGSDLPQFKEEENIFSKLTGGLKKKG